MNGIFRSVDDVYGMKKKRNRSVHWRKKAEKLIWLQDPFNVTDNVAMIIMNKKVFRRYCLKQVDRFQFSTKIMTNNWWTLNETVSPMKRFICHFTGNAYLAFVSVTLATINRIASECFARHEMRFGCFWGRFSCFFFCVQQKVWLFVGLWSVHTSRESPPYTISPQCHLVSLLSNSMRVTLQLALIYGVPTHRCDTPMTFERQNINKRVRWMPNSDDKPHAHSPKICLFSFL